MFAHAQIISLHEINGKATKQAKYEINLSKIYKEHILTFNHCGSLQLTMLYQVRPNSSYDSFEVTKQSIQNISYRLPFLIEMNYPCLQSKDEVIPSKGLFGCINKCIF